MKISKRQLKRIIKEERHRLLKESWQAWEEIDIALSDIVDAVGEDNAVKYVKAWVNDDRKTMEKMKKDDVKNAPSFSTSDESTDNPNWRDYD